MRSKATPQKKPVMIVRIIKTPIRALRRAKDIYIKGITIFSATYNRPIMVSEDNNRTTEHLPRSSSTTMLSSDHTLHQPPRGLVRANSSAATQFCMADLERYMIQKQNQQLQSCGTRKGVPKSCSVTMVKIDEDRVSSFREDSIIFKRKVAVNNNASRLPRNCSYARDAL